MRRVHALSDLVFTINHIYRPYPDSVIKTINSTIYKAQDLDLKRDVCIKEVNIAGEKDKEVRQNLKKAMSEASTMIKIRGKTDAVPTIYLTYYDEEKRKLYIVMDWIIGNTLDYYINSNRMCFDEKKFLKWIETLCDVLKEMSGQKLYHKDIKPQNIIIDNNEKLHLLDFNISVSLPNKLEGTPLYRAPEMETSKSVRRDKVDVFSIGVILYQYYTGKIPMKGSEYAQTSKRKYNKDWDYFVPPKEIKRTVSESMNKIIVNCMQKDVEKRYEIRDVKHEIQGYLRKLRNGKKEYRRN